MVWAIFLFVSYTCNAQNEAYLNYIIKSETSKESRITKVDSLLRKLESEQDDSLHYWYQIYAYWLFDVKEKKQAIQNEKKAFDFAKARSDVKRSFVQRSGTYLAFYYTQNGQHLESIEAYKDVINVDKASKYAVTAYLNLGYSYLKIHDYYNAVEHFELAISLLEGGKKNLKALREAHQNIAATTIKIRTPEAINKGRYHGQIADSLAQIIPTSEVNKYKIKYALAQLYSRDEAFDFSNAKKYYDEVNLLSKKTKDTSKLITSYLGYGILYKDYDQDKSISYLEQAQQFVRPKDSFLSYQIWTTLGYNYALKNNLTKSIDLRHQGLSVLSGNSFRNYEFIDDEFLINSDRKINLLYALPRLADCYLSLFKKNKDSKALAQSTAYFEMADYLIDLIRINSNEFKSRLFWRELSATVYSKAIEACYLNNDIEKAFYYMEKNKALLLMEDLARQDFRNSLRLESTLLLRENDLRKRIQLVASKLNQPSTQNDLSKKELLDLKIELSQLQDSIFGTKKTINLNPKILGLNDLQASLSPDEVFIEYHFSVNNEAGFNSKSESGFIFIAHAGNAEIIEIQESGKIRSEFTYLINAIKSPFKTTRDLEEYNSRSFKAFQLLFPTSKIRELIKNKKLIIATDDYLSFFPIEALTTRPDGIRYLLQDSEVRYLYSRSFLESNRLTTDKKNALLGMAPVQFSDASLAPLWQSEKELQVIQEFYSGNMLTKESATKSTFLKELSTYKIIHLATHADAQDASAPWIAFYDGKITLDELYQTQNNASLVVLSGCNTTLGKQEIGEGVMSLARGFFYSGAQSVMSTLWSIDDRSTATITQDFYKNLAEGQTKSEALRNAKLGYLETHRLSETSPYYWASFIMIGDNAPVPSAIPIWKYFLFGGLGLLLLFLGYRVLNSRTRQSTSQPS